jgi:hypothetical protein
MRELIILLGFGIIAFFVNKEAFWFVYLVAEAVSLAVILIFVFIRKIVTHKSIVDFHKKIVFSESFNGSCEKISDTCERIQGFMENHNIGMKQAMMITLAVDETCRIIATQSGDLKLQITLVIENDVCVVHIRDNASKFNPMEIDENSDEGFGLKIVRKKTKEYYYRQFVGFNMLTLLFERAV